MSKIEVNTVEPQSGTTLTLGASGDTVTLGSGASQSGFGRTGTVNWQTGSVKTATFTAANGEGYFVNTAGGAVTMNLPSSPSAGNIVAVKDYNGSFATNNLTLGRGGSKINGSSDADVPIATDGASLVLVYVDGTQGWKGTETSNLNDIELQPEYIAACGGTETTSGNFKIHTFTSPGTFTVTCAGNPLGSNTVDYYVIAGGGGGGGGDSTHGGGGGGAGGYRESSGAASGCYTASPLGSGVSALPVSAQGYPITVGAGGASCATGNNSIFSTITSTGGGDGGKGYAQDGSDGGSGGGGAVDGGPGSGGSGNTPPVTPPQGNNGADAGTSYAGAGGGGGAGAVGNQGTCGQNNANGGPGGNGVASSISGSPTTRAGGGAGASRSCRPANASGGSGGGGGAGPSGSSGTANTGGGGGGGLGSGTSGGTGGSGIVIIRYKFQ